MTALATPRDARLDRAIQACLAGLSLNTQACYRPWILRFERWQHHAQVGLTRASVSLWAESLGAAGATTASITQALSAVKRLAQEAANNGWLPHEQAIQICSIRSPRYRGVRTGHWLTLEQAARLLALPDRQERRGRRDACLLALLIGCGLRRAEACALPLEAMRWSLGQDGPVLKLENLQGKGGRVRTIAVPRWAERDIEAWRLEVLNSTRQRLIALSPGRVRAIVRGYCALIGLPDIAPHDLRRTMARLSRDGGAPLEVIQQTLGHASIQTTERYLGSTTAADAGRYIEMPGSGSV